MGPLEIVARCHAAAAQVAQMPSTPHPADRDLRRWETLREMRAELDPVALARAVAALGAQHSCALLSCPWGRRGEPPQGFDEPLVTAERADFLAGLARRRQVHTHSMPSASAVGESR
jgi:hypothetical protein